MKQRDVTDNATGYNRWDPKQPRSEDRTDEGQVKKNAACQSLGLCPPFWEMVAHRSWGRSPAGVARSKPWIVGTLEAHGGVRLLPCTRIHLCFVLAVDLSTQHQHPVRARGTWDFALNCARRLNNTLHRKLTR